jgi:DNA-directed RNA polymerase sigma subunit (sigma70/sigma32)
MGYMEASSGPQGSPFAPSSPVSLEGQVRRTEFQLNGGQLDLVAAIASKYVGRGLPEEELRLAGHRGLKLAIRGYSPEDGMPFGTFASWWIKDAIRRALARRDQNTRLVPGRDAHQVEAVAPEGARREPARAAERQPSLP